MSQTFLLDTSFVVAFLRRDAPRSVLNRMNELITAGNAATNGMVRMEVLVGCRTAADYDLVSRQFGAMRTLAINDDIWSRSARLGFDLRRAGATVGVADLVIASTAIRHAATLIHIDSDFETIAQHSDLRTESYVGSV